MSCKETKVVVRLYLPELEGDMKKALAFYRKHFGEPEEVFEDESYFYYESPKNNSKLKDRMERNVDLRDPENIRPYLHPVYRGNQFGVEVWLAHRDYNSYNSMGLRPGILHGDPIDLDDVLEIRKFLDDEGFDTTWMSFHSYTWYNGGDEPVKFHA